MLCLTEDAKMSCDHARSGKIKSYDPAQSWVTIERRKVLVQPDPVGRSIDGCIMKPPQVPKQCTKTLAVSTGYSTLVSIGGRKVCLASVVGVTDGVPPTSYRVDDSGQRFVDSAV
jgi:hypothetical protein